MKILYLFIFLALPLWADSKLQEVKSTLSTQQLLSEESLQMSAEKIHTLKKQINALKESSSSAEALLSQAQKLKLELSQAQEDYRKLAGKTHHLSSYIHEPGISLEELIYEYASLESLYIIPQEMAKIPFYVSSSLLINPLCWEEIIEIVCQENGIGIKEINPMVKSLYWLMNKDYASLNYLVSDFSELLITPGQKRVCYLQTFEGDEIETIYYHLKRLINERTLSMQRFHRQILLMGRVDEVTQLAKLMDFLKKNKADQSYTLLAAQSLTKEEIESIIQACFEINDRSKSPLFVLPIKQHVLLMGSQKNVEKAQVLIEEISNKACSPDQMAIYNYQCRYSDPLELAHLLQQIYNVLSCSVEQEAQAPQENSPPKTPGCTQRPGTIPPICMAPNLVVDPKATPPQKEFSEAPTFPNFIVDSKTGMIMMVVKKNTLETLLQTLNRLDTPKQMVEMEVILFEKKITDQTQFGLNILKLGDNVSSNEARLSWNVPTQNRSLPGILNYFFSRSHPSEYFPPFNFAYHLLMSQDDICIHSNPTITTVNQTQAVIDLVEEQSLNMGTVEDPRTSVISNTFVRAQYGIIIKITPTINYGNQGNPSEHQITLDTDITFDTTTSDVDNRPDVSRRHIQNQVRVQNGETLILGGLRRKNSTTRVDKIPFIGDIPWLGKLFSYTSLEDSATEMFILITPKIVEEKTQQLKQYQIEELKKRPGDSPELFKRLLEAKRYEKRSSNHFLFKSVSVKPDDFL